MISASEKQIHTAVIDHWRACGLPGTLVVTIPNMRAAGQVGLTKGLPDLMVLAPGLPIGFLELKTEKGKVAPDQIVFSHMCSALGIHYAMTRGRDEPIDLLEHWGVVKPRAA